MGGLVWSSIREAFQSTRLLKVSKGMILFTSSTSKAVNRERLVMPVENTGRLSFFLYHVLVGNGTSIPIAHIGDTLLSFGFTTVSLENLLVISDLKRNLLSMGQLTSSHPIICVFDHIRLNIMDRKT